MPARMIIAMLLALLISTPAIAQDINSQLIEAAKNGDTVSIKALLDAGADVNAKNEDGLTALWWAAGHTEIVELLKKAGAKE
ncbi:MAG: ankyrin repeat domain-containing protein [Acidobacteria bacterium]|nr:ankyrin repeat domain-containing protein [Acidobacteriota bacterium]